MEDVLTLPKTLQELYVLFSNPIIMAVFFSMMLEQTPLIKDPAVANIKKVLLVLAVAEAWAVIVAAFAPEGFVFTPQGIYAVVASGLALAFSMNLWNKLVNDGLPWLRDLLVTLFGRKVAVG